MNLSKDGEEGWGDPCCDLSPSPCVLLLYSSWKALVPSYPHDLTTSSPTTEQDPALDNAHVVLGQISAGVRAEQIILQESITFRRRCQTLISPSAVRKKEWAGNCS